jgi:outer membrane immunogenic protein
MHVIRTQSIALAAFAAFTSAAYAADMGLPLKAPPAVAPLPQWTGFYLGANLGGGFGDKWWNCTPALTCDAGPNSSIGTTSMDGFLGGFQVGYNWQSGLWVFGVEGTWDWTDMHGQFPGNSSTDPGFAGETPSSKIKWLATVVGRVGITIDRALVYAGGGVAWAHESDTDDLCPCTGTNTSVGATFLTGVEYWIDPHWSARIQYNFYDFGSKDVSLQPDFPVATELSAISIRPRRTLRARPVGNLTSPRTRGEERTTLTRALPAR